MFKANGVDIEIVLKPLRYKTDDSEPSKVDTNVQGQGKTATEEEVEERADDTI
jgi:hypothetical protein